MMIRIDYVKHKFRPLDSTFFLSLKAVRYQMHLRFDAIFENALDLDIRNYFLKLNRGSLRQHRTAEKRSSTQK